MGNPHRAGRRPADPNTAAGHTASSARTLCRYAAGRLAAAHPAPADAVRLPAAGHGAGRGAARPGCAVAGASGPGWIGALAGRTLQLPAASRLRTGPGAGRFLRARAGRCCLVRQ
ncbi:hypothetical protein DSI35_05995 [Mycobacterium tuberculosis]|nr:hypothetical protein DSI35_05995 [Mycobacterium tuberculosis]